MVNMKMPTRKTQPGFTLLELMVAIALGLIVMGALAGLFKAGMESAMLLTQRTETQQNMRAAIDLMVKDISMAGAGLPSGGIQLPFAHGKFPRFFDCPAEHLRAVTARGQQPQNKQPRQIQLKRNVLRR